MIVEREEQGRAEVWRRLQSYMKIRSEQGQGPTAALHSASQSPYFSQSGKLTSLCGQFELLMDVMTPLMNASPEEANNLIRKFDIKENWPQGFANGLGDTIMFLKSTSSNLFFRAL